MLRQSECLIVWYLPSQEVHSQKELLQKATTAVEDESMSDSEGSLPSIDSGGRDDDSDEEADAEI